MAQEISQLSINDNLRGKTLKSYNPWLDINFAPQL